MEDLGRVAVAAEAAAAVAALLVLDCRSRDGVKCRTPGRPLPTPLMMACAAGGLARRAQGVAAAAGVKNTVWLLLASAECKPGVKKAALAAPLPPSSSSRDTVAPSAECRKGAGRGGVA